MSHPAFGPTYKVLPRQLFEAGEELVETLVHDLQPKWRSVAEREQRQRQHVQNLNRAARDSGFPDQPRTPSEDEWAEITEEAEKADALMQERKALGEIIDEEIQELHRNYVVVETHPVSSRISSNWREEVR